MSEFVYAYATDAMCFLMFYNYVYANNGVATSIMS